MAKALTFGSLNLIGTDAELAANGYRFEALANDTEWGNGVPIDQQVESWLQDGAIISRSGYNNRPDMVIRLRVKGTDANYLALAEQQLMLETGKPNLLTWTPPGTNAQPCVFSVVMSTLEHSFDDLGEVRSQPERIYLLRIQAEPFVRSQTAVTVTVPAPSGSQTITTIDNCNSATNWSAASQYLPSGTPSSASVTALGTALSTVVNNRTPAQPFIFDLTRSSLSQSLSGTPYIRIGLGGVQPIAFSNVTGSGPTFFLNGIAATPVTQNRNAYWFDASALGITTLTQVKVRVSGVATDATNATTIIIDDVSRSNVVGDIVTTNRQLVRTLPVAGSARTQGNLSLSDASNGLGTTLIHTQPLVPGMATPNLRQFFTSGGTQTPDSSRISGFTSNLINPHTFEIPVGGLVPGGYLLLAYIMHASTGVQSVQWGATSKVGSTLITSDGQSGTTSVSLTAGTYKFAPLAALNLPVRAMGPSGLVRISLLAPNVTLDDAWLFNIEEGALTKVDCGSGTPTAGSINNRLWLDAPTVTSPVPGVYMGTQADRSDAYRPAAEMESLGAHQFEPSATVVTTITTGSTNSTLSLTHNPRSHTHVAS